MRNESTCPTRVVSGGWPLHWVHEYLHSSCCSTCDVAQVINIPPPIISVGESLGMRIHVHSVWASTPMAICLCAQQDSMFLTRLVCLGHEVGMNTGTTSLLVWEWDLHLRNLRQLLHYPIQSPWSQHPTFGLSDTFFPAHRTTPLRA